MVFFIILAIFFSGCSFLKQSRKNHNYKFEKKRNKKKGQRFLFKIDNLHCKLCAYNLVKYISKKSGVNNIEFNLLANRYQDSYFEIYINKKEIDIQEVYGPLIKSGFSVRDVKS